MLIVMVDFCCLVTGNHSAGLLTRSQDNVFIHDHIYFSCETLAREGEYALHLSVQVMHYYTQSHTYFSKLM